MRFFQGIVCIVMLTSCGNAILDSSSVGMPDRDKSADLSRVSSQFRSSGGNAFVRLTAEPTAAALDVLSRSGLGPADGRSHILTFDALRVATVWGKVAPNAVARPARLGFVTAIEPSADRITGW